MSATTTTYRDEAQALAAQRFRIAHTEHPALRELFEIASGDIQALLALGMREGLFLRNPAFAIAPELTIAPGDLTPDDFTTQRISLAPDTEIGKHLTVIMRTKGDTSEALAHCIRHDIMLSLSLLRLVYSPLYAESATPHGINEAIERIGSRQLASLAHGATQLGVAHKTSTRLPLGEYRRHSIAVATIAKLIAEITGRNNSDAYYTAGLMHDIGRLFLVNKLGSQALGLYREAMEEEIPLHIVEERYLGFNHAAIGTAILKKWNFPEELIDAVTHHHTPSQQSSDMAHVIHVADIIARALGYNYWGDAYLPPLSSASWNRVGLSIDRLANLARTAHTAIDSELPLQTLPKSAA